jgi:hypothetical protein
VTLAAIEGIRRAGVVVIARVLDRFVNDFAYIFPAVRDGNGFSAIFFTNHFRHHVTLIFPDTSVRPTRVYCEDEGIHH